MLMNDTIFATIKSCKFWKTFRFRYDPLPFLLVIYDHNLFAGFVKREHVFIKSMSFWQQMSHPYVLGLYSISQKLKRF